MFDVNSRYHEIPIAELITPEGRKIVYVRRRFIPPAPTSVALAEHSVTEGERLDNITARYIGDPEQFWRFCDANNAMKPEELEAVGRRLRVPTLEGF